jgi:putative SOS response-associated peptidase YedK
MCGRYVLAVEGGEFTERFQLRQLPFELFPRWNAAPGQSLPVIVEEQDGGRAVKVLHWGLIPRWGQREGERIAPINARVEGIGEKAMFRNLVTRRRCLVPANGFYEWRGDGKAKQPFYIHEPGEPLFAFAGVWDETTPDRQTPGEAEPEGSFSILTMHANETMMAIHHRMPAILMPDAEEGWLDPTVTSAEAATSFVRMLPEDVLTMRPVSTAVNNVRNEGPDLLEPYSPPKEPQQASLF